MATPRKHWFRVADSVRDEPWTNDQLAFLIRLMAELNTRWARNGLDWKSACSIELNGTDLMALSGKHRVDVARKSAEHLADIASMSISHRGNITLISWSKYAEFQGLTPRESPESRPLRKTPPQDARRKTQEEISETPSAPPAPRARRARPKSPCPDSLSEPEWQGVRQWAYANGLGHIDLLVEWDAMCDHWRGKDELRADWVATFRTWLRNAKRFAARDAQRNLGLSPAQAKAERTKEAGRQGYEMYMASKQVRALKAIEGGQS